MTIQCKFPKQSKSHASALDRLSEHRGGHRRKTGLPRAGRSGLRQYVAAVFADVGVMIIAVLNAIRALFVKNL